VSKQDKAIHEYLQALLQDVPDEAATQPQFDEAESVTQTKILGIEGLVAEIPEVIVETETVTENKTEVVEVEVIEEPVAEIVTEVKGEHVAEELVAVAQAYQYEKDIPVWAEQAFQCLLFKVSGLTLAVPLVKLNSVIPWSDKLVETPNQTDWYLGLVNHLGSNVKVIDTALMVLPENRHADIESDPADRFSHILLVDDAQWGLACDTIGDVIWLNADEVKWRKDKVKRAWLAGTAVERLCALMDTEVFADMLNDKTTA
jgi:purine-binding chemotaxis protein CheW